MLLLSVAVALAAPRHDVPALIEDGRCDEALQAAQQAVRAAPEDAEAAKQVGDAWRCLDDPARALTAYRTARELGYASGAITSLIALLEPRVAQLDLTLHGLGPGTPLPEVVILRDDEAIEAYASAPPLWQFRDLPLGVPLELRATGPGMAPATLAVGNLAAGGVSARDWTIDFVSVPARVSVVGAPAGTTVTLSGPAAPPAIVAPSAGRKLDDTLGLEIAEVVKVADLAPGTYRVELDHPVLGAWSDRVDAIGGEVSTVQVDVRRFPYASLLEGAWARHRQALAARRKPPGAVWAGVGITTVALGLAGAGVATWGRSRGKLAEAWDAYEAALDGGDTPAARARYLEIGEARRSFVVPAMLLGAGTAGFGLGVTVTFERWGAHLKSHRVAPWDPAAALREPGAAPPPGP